MEKNPGGAPISEITHFIAMPFDFAGRDLTEVAAALGLGLEAAAEAIRPHSARDAERWPGFTELVHKLARFLSVLYRVPPPDVEATRPAELWSLLGMVRELRKLGRRDMVELLRTVPMSVQEILDDRFESALLKAGVAGVGVTGIRQGPRSGGTGFVLLHRLVGGLPGAMGTTGGRYWKSDPAALAAALVEAAGRLGVAVRLKSEAREILVREERVTGVRLGDGEELQAPLVLSSADPAQTMLSLVDPIWLDPELIHAVRQIRHRGSTTHISFALEAEPPFPGVDPAGLEGALSLTGSGDELERAADAAKYRKISPEPFVTLRLLSRRWPGLAPAGKAVMTAEVQWTPWNPDGGSWTAEHRTALEHSVTTVIERVSPGFRDRIVAREVLTPVELSDRYGLPEGAASHGELMLDQILFMRPVPALARYRTPIGGLYLGGSGQHPGPGIRGMAGYLAAREALRS